MLFSDLPKSVARLALRAAPRYIPYKLLLSRKTKCIPPATLVPYNGCSYLTPCVAPCLGTLVSELRKKNKKKRKGENAGFHGDNYSALKSEGRKALYLVF